MSRLSRMTSRPSGRTSLRSCLTSCGTAHWFICIAHHALPAAVLCVTPCAPAATAVIDSTVAAAAAISLYLICAYLCAEGPGAVFTLSHGRRSHQASVKNTLHRQETGMPSEPWQPQQGTQQPCERLRCPGRLSLAQAHPMGQTRRIRHRTLFPLSLIHISEPTRQAE